MSVFINMIKIMAAFLITNSHMGSLYPKNIFAFGGALGNALFFIVAGYCLSSKRKNEFIPWMRNRLQRLYIPLWSVTLILLIIGDITIDRSYFLATFLFPYNSFWFVSAIILNYMAFYFIRKYFVKQLLIVATFAIGVYLIWYIGFLDTSVWSVENAGFFKYVFYFLVMLSGVALKEHEKMAESYLKGKSGLFLTISVACLVGYVIMKGLMLKIPSLMQFQFIVQVFTWGFAVALFLYMWSIENQLKKYFTGHIFRVVADSTLEIYLVNMMVINRMNAIGGILSVPIAFILIFIIGCCIHVITSKIISCVWGICKKETH